jgi:xanthine dehydrogenase accessory factor
VGLESARHWGEAVSACVAAGEAYVLVTLLGTRGSTPRDSGSKMVITATACHGSIGGGELEYRAQARALALLEAGVDVQRLENVPLGEKLGQCCGGSTSLLFECFCAARLPVLLFGAGHVGRALAPLLATLPLRLTWIDSRAEAFPAALPAAVECRVVDELLDLLCTAPAGSAVLIMTHQHPLDFALTEAALRRGDASYIGLIGSHSKWRRFRLRLAQRGYSEAQLAAVHCPVGLPAVPGKLPAEIAVAVAAQLIAHYHALRGEAETASGPSWKAQQQLLGQTGVLAQLMDTDNT